MAGQPPPEVYRRDIEVMVAARRPDGSGRDSDRAVGDAHDLFSGGHALIHLDEAVLAQGHHAAFAAGSAKLGDVGISGDGVAEEVVEYEQLIEAQTTGVAGGAAMHAA